ncbi:TIGR02281 family clan AA aspartic protease [Allorhizobium sp. BGMRC 0089]|uniref:retropepsin-like aspartic protease family protein n=1 Tax=Allorhizobium sonneratiae TaxID=2934936 RepID=UPI002033E4AF|nr:TIGR02281 family clan AA aspartic protease [Allorhizobium sonneratiae]MCM2292946.1 TIGR02281 family clan AA aspartic protease [Allorhizobium sonneratiae]
MRLAVVLAILLFGLAALMLMGQGDRTLGLANDDFGNLIFLLPFAFVIASGIVVSRANLGRNLRFLAAWVLIGLVVVTGYVYRDDAQAVGNRVLGAILPDYAISSKTADGQAMAILNRNRNGHFVTSVDIDGTHLKMMIDTGASAVVLSAEEASRLGIDTSSLHYTVTVSTANGNALAAPVVLKAVSVGPIERKNVRALVTQPGRLSQGLLGMSYLSTLDSVQIRGDELRLID